MDSWKTVLKGVTAKGDEQYNVFYHETSAAIGDALSTIELFVADWVLAAKAMTDQHSGWRTWEGYRWDGTSWHPEGAGSCLTLGTNTDPQLPQTDAAVIVADTGVKRVRPKKFLGGLTISDLTDGYLSTAALGHLASLMALWVDVYTAGSVTLTPGTWRKAAKVFVPIISAVIDNVLGTQRSRKEGKGA